MKAEKFEKRYVSDWEHFEKLVSKLSNKLHLSSRYCWNCGAFTEWGRLCWDCVRAMLISAATVLGAVLVGWWLG